MPGFVREHLRPLAGSAGLHLLLVTAMAVATLRWTSPPPSVQLAIEGVVVDSRSLPDSLRGGRPKPQPAPAPEPQPEPEPEPEPAAPVPAPDPPPVPVKAPEEPMKASERAAEEAVLQARAEAKKTAEARQKKQAEADAQSKAKADEAARREAAEADARRKQQDEAKAAQDAKVKTEREADLKRRLAAEAAEEEGAMAMARSGVVDEYRTLLSQAIERSWIRPPSAKAGLECTLYVSQAPGGTVVDVKLGTCNGDQSVRESIVNAVYRASPLPAPRDSRAFERRLEIVFRPTE
jgi:colicin import membrane protein